MVGRVNRDTPCSNREWKTPTLLTTNDESAGEAPRFPQRGSMKRRTVASVSANVAEKSLHCASPIRAVVGVQHRPNPARLPASLTVRASSHREGQTRPVGRNRGARWQLSGRQTPAVAVSGQLNWPADGAV
jgi:hypothetical protein